MSFTYVIGVYLFDFKNLTGVALTHIREDGPTHLSLKKHESVKVIEENETECWCSDSKGNSG